MSWRKEVAQIVKGIKPEDELEYDKLANDSYSIWLPWLPITATKIFRPRNAFYHEPGYYSFVIFRPTLSRLFKQHRVKLVIESHGWGHKHGDLARTRRVLATGEMCFVPTGKRRGILRRRTTEIGGITNHSGHYDPPIEAMATAKALFQALRLPMRPDFKIYSWDDHAFSKLVTD